LRPRERIALRDYSVRLVPQNGGNAQYWSRLVSASDEESMIGAGVRITGTILCSGTMTIAGHVKGDVHATEFAVAAGGTFEGNVVACGARIAGRFDGLLYANTAKIESPAVAEAKLFCGKLMMEGGASFVGIVRRLTQTVEPPSLLLSVSSESIAPFAEADAHGWRTPRPT
jgi:cytoskeletal protein CcmA (bactofilin family)